jgi:hypothetical protein
MWEFSKVLMKTKFSSDAFKCGRHSDFPLCCIIFYIYIWAPTYIRSDDPKLKYSFTRLYLSIKDKVIRWRKITHTCINDYDGELMENVPGFGRVACPFCLFFGKKNWYVPPCDCNICG